MIIHTVWVVRESQPHASPELIAAWDEYSVDENPDGYKEYVADQVERCGEPVEVRNIDVVVSETSIEAAFDYVSVEGRVRE